MSGVIGGSKSNNTFQKISGNPLYYNAFDIRTITEKQQNDDVLYVDMSSVSIYNDLSDEELKMKLDELYKSSMLDYLKMIDNSDVENDIKVIRAIYEKRGNQIITENSLNKEISEIDKLIEQCLKEGDFVESESLKEKKKSYELLKMIVNSTNMTFYSYDELLKSMSDNILDTCYNKNDYIFDAEKFKILYNGYNIEDYYRLLVDFPESTDDPLLLFKAQEYISGKNVKLMNEELSEKKEQLARQYIVFNSDGTINQEKTNYMMLAMLSFNDEYFRSLTLDNDDYQFYDKISEYRNYATQMTEDEIKEFLRISEEEPDKVYEYLFEDIKIVRVGKPLERSDEILNILYNLENNLLKEKFNYVFNEEEYQLNYQYYSMYSQMSFQIEYNYNLQMLENDDFSDYLSEEDIKVILEKETKQIDNIDDYSDEYEKIAYYLTDDEKKLYHYRLKKYGEESAKKYLLFLKDSLRMRAGQEKAAERLEKFKVGEDENGNPIYEFDGWDQVTLVAMGFQDGFRGFGEGLVNVFFADGEKSCFDYEKVFIMQALTADEETGKIFSKSLGYEFGSSMGNMMPVMAANFIPFVGPYVSTGLMALSSYGNNREELLQQGYSDDYRTFFNAAFSAMSEVALEKFLGTIPGISVVNKSAQASGMGANKSLAKFLKFVALNAGQEGIEESTQVIVDSIIASICLGEEFSVDINELMKSGLLGAMSGGVMNATNVGISVLPVSINGIKCNLETSMIETFGITNEFLLNEHYKTALAEALPEYEKKTDEGKEKAAKIMEKAGFGDIANNIRMEIGEAKSENEVNNSVNEESVVSVQENQVTNQIDTVQQISETNTTENQEVTDVNTKTFEIKLQYADDNVLVDGMSCHMIMPELLIETLNNKGLTNVFTIQDGVYVLNDVDANTKYEVLNTIANFVSNDVGQMVLDNETTLDAWSTGVGKDVTSRGNMAEFIFNQGKVEQANTMLTNLITKISDFRQELINGVEVEQTETLEIEESIEVLEVKEESLDKSINVKQDLNTYSEIDNISEFISAINLSNVLNGVDSSVSVGTANLNLGSITETIRTELKGLGITADNVSNLTNQQLNDLCDMLAFYSTRIDGVEYVFDEVSNLRDNYQMKLSELSSDALIDKVNLFNQYMTDLSNLIIANNNLNVDITETIQNKDLSKSSVNEVDYSFTRDEKKVIVDILQKTNNLQDLSILSEIDYSDKVILQKYLQSGAAKTLLSLSQEQYNALFLYMSNSYKSINSYLDNDVDVELTFGLKASDAVRLIDEVMFANTVEETCILQRGATISDLEGLSLSELPGKILTHNRNRSTCSGDLNTVGTERGGIFMASKQDEQRVKIDYICPKGTRAVNLGMITSNDVESEITIGRNQRIRYEAVKMDGDTACVLAVVLPDGVADDVSIKDLVDSETYDLISSRYGLNDLYNVSEINVSTINVNTSLENSNIDYGLAEENGQIQNTDNSMTSNFNINEIISNSDLNDLPDILNSLSNEQLKDSLLELNSLNNVRNFFESVDSQRIESIIHNLNLDEFSKYASIFDLNSAKYFLDNFNQNFVESNINNFSEDTIIQISKLITRDNTFGRLLNSPKQILIQHDGYISRITESSNINFVKEILKLKDKELNNYIFRKLDFQFLQQVILGNENIVEKHFKNLMFLDEELAKNLYPVIENNSNISLSLKNYFKDQIKKWGYSIKVQPSAMQIVGSEIKVVRTNGSELNVKYIGNVIVNGITLNKFIYNLAGKQHIIYDNNNILNLINLNSEKRDVLVDEFLSNDRLEECIKKYDGFLGNYGFVNGIIQMGNDLNFSYEILKSDFKNQIEYYFINNSNLLSNQISDSRIINILSNSFEYAFRNNIKDEIDIFKAIIKAKQNNPDLTFENVSEKVSYWNWRDTLINLTKKAINNSQESTVSHEMGHMLFALLLNRKLPQDFVKVASNAWNNVNANYKDMENYLKNVENNNYNKAKNAVEKQLSSVNKIRFYLEKAKYYKNKLKENNEYNFIEWLELSLFQNKKYKDNLIKKEKDRIYRTETPAVTAISDMLSGIFLGQHKNIFIPYFHTEDYYLYVHDSNGNVLKDASGQKILKNDLDRNTLMYDEQIANYSLLKRINATYELDLLKKTFGIDFYNMLESTYQMFVNYGRR